MKTYKKKNHIENITKGRMIPRGVNMYKNLEHKFDSIPKEQHKITLQEAKILVVADKGYFDGEEKWFLYKEMIYKKYGDHYEVFI